jgi:hypothetical protein
VHAIPKDIVDDTQNRRARKKYEEIRNKDIVKARSPEQMCAIQWQQTRGGKLRNSRISSLTHREENEEEKTKQKQ